MAQFVVSKYRLVPGTTVDFLRSSDRLSLRLESIDPNVRRLVLFAVDDPHAVMSITRWPIPIEDVEFAPDLQAEVFAPIRRNVSGEPRSVDRYRALREFDTFVMDRPPVAMAFDFTLAPDPQSRLPWSEAGPNHYWPPGLVSARLLEKDGDPNRLIGLGEFREEAHMAPLKKVFFERHDDGIHIQHGRRYVTAIRERRNVRLAGVGRAEAND